MLPTDKLHNKRFTWLSTTKSITPERIDLTTKIVYVRGQVVSCIRSEQNSIQFIRSTKIIKINQRMTILGNIQQAYKVYHIKRLLILITFFYWHRVSSNSVLTNPVVAQTLDKEFPANAPWVIEGKISPAQWRQEIVCTYWDLDLGGSISSRSRSLPLEPTPRGFDIDKTVEFNSFISTHNQISFI